MAAAVTDPLTEHPWWPKTKAQEAFLDCSAELLLYGGSAGSLKTHALCLDLIQERDNKNLRGLFLRESYPQLSDALDKMHRLYVPLGAQYNVQSKVWKFPSGATVQLGYLAADRDVYEYWGKEFSVIDFDESTRFTEYQRRTVLSRLRSTDPSLRLRSRWGSNPGEVGAGDHKHIFLHGHCPVHEPTQSAIPGRVYSRDSRVWPSDGTPIPMTVAFIPGKLSDHSLLGDNYAKMLRMQSGSLATSLELGCWCSLAGSYFAGAWDKAANLKPLAEMGLAWWNTYWISLDYGFGKSSASAHLHAMTSDGKPRTIGEYVVPHKPAYEFAQEVVERFVIPPAGTDTQGKQIRRRMVAVYLDPSNFKDIGDGHTIAEQIDEVLQPYGLSCTRASNDRIGGWQLMYRLLKSREWQVAETCPKLIEAIPTRMHDEKKPGDLLKVLGDPLDDVADEVRYGLYTFMTAAEKPLPIRVKEVYDKTYEATGDETSAMINAMRTEGDSSYETQPVYFGRRPRYR